MGSEFIRNFSIIAHIDHGKSTLADRMLEQTNTVTKREMREQVLDTMELERERGITIKMQPARMEYEHDGKAYVLNVIDTPGHIDFSYEVSRALKAVEGVILLVDSTQGVQAQTLTVLSMAREMGLSVIPALSKVDSNRARVEDVKKEVCELLGCSSSDIIETSGKTGAGVGILLQAIVTRIPHPSNTSARSLRSLIFDFSYSDHRGVIVYTRLFDGDVSKGDQLTFSASGTAFNVLEVGTFSPEQKPKESLSEGEIGYIVTGIKEPGMASVGDTLIETGKKTEALPGYMSPRPVVWASLYPESQDDFLLLRQALNRLRLSDSSFSFEEESGGALGKGFRCGFLGMLHVEIVTERLRREFNLELVVTAPTVVYEIEEKDGGKRVPLYIPSQFPDDGAVHSVFEPWVLINIIVNPEYTSGISKLLFEHEAEIGETETFGNTRVVIRASMPLRELMRGFFDKLKSVSAGFASLSYTSSDMRRADVIRLDLLIAEESVPALTRIVSRRRAQNEAESAVEKLYKTLPRQQFVMKIQAKGMGRILAARRLSALKKDVTGHLYGGDITRKRKLWEKQKKGKKRLASQGKVIIPQKVFIEMIKPD